MHVLVGISVALCALTGLAYAQEPTQESVAEVLLRGNIVAKNIQTAINIHLVDEPDFHPAKQQPEDKQDLPKILIKKDGSLVFDWTDGQQARSLMEALRQGVHALQSTAKPRGLDAIALAGAREYWPKLRDISCAERPGIRYYDLDGFERFCPEKEH